MKTIEKALKQKKAGKPVWDYFTKRIRSSSQAKKGLPYQKVTPPDNIKTLNKAFLELNGNKTRVIYIHIPFCHQICDFCNYSKQLIENESTVEKFYQIVLSHIQQAGSIHGASSQPFNAVYFGGGSPTAIKLNYLVKTINQIKKHLPLSRDFEITVESTISESKNDYLKVLRETGVNRISLGVQSFNTRLRKHIGRSANKNKVENTINSVSETGYKNICIDLIYNLPHQNLDLWKEDLSLIESLPITGCSVYPLITFPHKNKQKKTDSNKKNLKLEYDYFAEADNHLSSLPGWQRLTPVQYGHQENGRARYIESQSQFPEILAFGPSAAGRIGKLMYFNTHNMKDFLKNNDFINNTMSILRINEDFLRLNRIYSISDGLFLSASEYERLQDDFHDIINSLLELEFITESPEGIHLTTNGTFWAGNISSAFTDRIKDIIQKNDTFLTHI